MSDVHKLIDLSKSNQSGLPGIKPLLGGTSVTGTPSSVRPSVDQPTPLNISSMWDPYGLNVDDEMVHSEGSNPNLLASGMQSRASSFT